MLFRSDYYPLPGPGERFPFADPYLPPRETPRPADDARFLQGLLEGIARIEALGYQRLAGLGGPALVSIRTVGGGARNAAWTAIRRRALGVELLPAKSEEAAVGAAKRKRPVSRVWRFPVWYPKVAASGAPSVAPEGGAVG